MKTVVETKIYFMRLEQMCFNVVKTNLLAYTFFIIRLLV